MELVDTHCHLTVFERQELLGVFERATEAGVGRMICVGATDGVRGAEGSCLLAEEFERVWATVGIHPHDAGSYQDLSLVAPLFLNPKVVAVGETGLDFFRDWAPREAQFELFRASIQMAHQLRKPLVIHCRDAEEDTLRVLREEGGDRLGGVFHCFSGDTEFAKHVLDLNFHLSFTGNVTFKKAEALREVIRFAPLDRMMVETDTPYMAPEPFRGKPSEPKHVRQVAGILASIKAIPLEEVARITTENAERLFGIR